MKLQIKTIKLQTMLAKAIKGASNNKLIPLTGLIAIQLKDGVLTMITTDATNYLYVRDFDVEGDDFYAVVQVDTFSKLVARMTCENTVLDLQESFMNVIGNGTYKIDLPLDEDGGVIKYPNPIEMVARTNQIGKVTVPMIKEVLNSVKQSLMTTNDYPWYTCYYVNDSVIATDTFKISKLNKQFFTEPKLISAEQMNLLDVIDDDEITVFADGDKLLFDSKHYTVYGVETPDIEEYSVDAINQLVNQKFGSMCKLAKEALLALFDRISLFVGAYDNGEVTLAFTNDGLMVSSKADTGTEVIPYIETKDFTEFICSANITMLVSQIKAQSGDTIELWFGDNSSLQIVDDDITSVIALLND